MSTGPNNPHSEDLNERHLIGDDDDDAFPTLGSLAALAFVVALGVVIWVVWL